MLRDNLSIINIIFECRALCYDRRGTMFFSAKLHYLRVFFTATSWKASITSPSWISL